MNQQNYPNLYVYAEIGSAHTEIYHVMLRGINRQSIFEDDEDYEKFLQTIADYKKDRGFKLYGYCLMGNHIHLLLKVEKEDLGQVFKRIGSRYVYWYNWKYRRSGPLFQDRFKSEPVEDDAYFITVLRYIHQNPIKAGLCDTLDSYKWSSHHEYLHNKGITDLDFALEIIGENNFAVFMNEKNDDKCLEIEEPKIRLNDDELKDKIFKDFNIKSIMIQNEPRDKCDCFQHTFGLI